MGAVWMDEDARRISAVVCVSSDVAATVSDHALPSCGGESFGDDQSGKTRADDQEIGVGVRFQGGKDSVGHSNTLPPLVVRFGRKRNLRWGSVDGGLASWRGSVRAMDCQNA